MLLVFFVYQHNEQLAAVSGLFILMLIWGYFKEGPIILAAKHYHNNDFERAEDLLMQIHKPEWLSKKRRGFYEYMLGGICLKQHKFEEAERHYELAAQFPLRSANDHVAALVHVANIGLRQNNYEKAEAYLKLATRQEDKISAKMKDVIARLQKELKNRKAN
ncbi:tetratricopeptide repeat protein [Mucilaginibacter paludis]|nr:tetratricopeptide repeat protein [Mucilaginibacter paludis]